MSYSLQLEFVPASPYASRWAATRGSTWQALRGRPRLNYFFVDDFAQLRQPIILATREALEKIRTEAKCVIAFRGD